MRLGYSVPTVQSVHLHPGDALLLLSASVGRGVSMFRVAGTGAIGSLTGGVEKMLRCAACTTPCHAMPGLATPCPGAQNATDRLRVGS